MENKYITEDIVPYTDIIDTIKEKDTEAKKSQKAEKIEKITSINKVPIIIVCILLIGAFAIFIDYAHAKRQRIPKPTMDTILEDAGRNGLRISNGNIIFPEDLKMVSRKQNFYLCGLFFTDYDIEIDTDIGNIYINQKAVWTRSLNKVASREHLIEANVSLAGKYEGTFSLSKESSVVYTADIEIFDDNSGVFTITSENGKTGKHYIKVTERGDLYFDLKGTKWITHPTFFIMTDFSAYYNAEKDALMPTSKSTEQFTFTRKNEDTE